MINEYNDNKDNMEHNAVLGIGRANYERRRTELSVDAEKAKEQAFGQIDREIGEELEFQYFRNAMLDIKKRGEIMMAKTQFSKDLMQAVAQELKINSEYVKIYKTTGTPLDKYHKVSAWIEILSPENGKTMFATLDIFTEQKNKRSGADIVFRMPESGFDDKNNEQYAVTLEEVVTQVVAKFKILGFKMNKGDKYNETKTVGETGQRKSKRVVVFRK